MTGKSALGTVVGYGKDENGLSARDDPETVGLGNRLPAGVDIKLLVDGLQVRFNGLIGNKQFFSDLFVLQPLSQQFQNIEFTIGQRLYQGLGRGGRAGRLIGRCARMVSRYRGVNWSTITGKIQDPLDRVDSDVLLA